MSQASENKEICRKALVALEEGDEAGIRKFYSPDHINHYMNVRGPDGWIETIRAWQVAFPDLHFELHSSVAEGDRVVHRWTATATHKGEFVGIPATGKKLEFVGLSEERVVNGQIVEEWSLVDMLGMMQQMGVIPAPA